jgi:predicted DNA-binding transcriptional regulator AlpA
VNNDDYPRQATVGQGPLAVRLVLVIEPALPWYHFSPFWFTLGVAVEVLRLSRRTLEHMRVDGTGPRYIKVGVGKRSRVLFREPEIEAWLSQFCFGSTSEHPSR